MKLIFIVAAFVLVAGAVAFFAFRDHQAQAADVKVQAGGGLVDYATAQKQFLTANIKKPGWKVTASGLQYYVVKAAQGLTPKPAPGSPVTVHYEGRLIDGSVFDSSYARKQPASFPLSGVIQGWQEGVPMMKVGEIWEFAIPSELGYGASGGGPIPPDSTLLFKVELLEAKSPVK